MNKILIITHSTYAEGIANAIKFFKYDIDNVYYINAYVEDQEFEKALIVKLNEIGTEDLIVLSDLLGGSVNQVALKLMNEYKYKLITGVNLPLVLDSGKWETNELIDVSLKSFTVVKLSFLV